MRLKRCFSQQALAELGGIPHTNVSAMELGAKFPNLLTILRLAVAQECRVIHLVGIFDETNLRALLEK